MTVTQVCILITTYTYMYMYVHSLHLTVYIVTARLWGNIYTMYCTWAGAVLGFTNLGDINGHLKAFERLVSGEEDVSMPVANSMLVLMVRGLFSRLEYPYAQFPCNSLAADDMFDPFWKAVSRLECLGLKVMGLCCDGLAANCRLFSLHSDSNAHKVVNPFSDENRFLYFFTDPPHLLKTVRNAWANPKRPLWVCSSHFKCAYASIHVHLHAPIW